MFVCAVEKENEIWFWMKILEIRIRKKKIVFVCKWVEKSKSQNATAIPLKLNNNCE